MSSLVLKFGGTSVGSIKAISFVAEKIKKFKKNGARLVVIVSAMSGETNRLLGMAKEYDIPVLFGVRIASVNDGGGADDAGLEEGDVVVAINDNDVKNVSNLQEMVAINRPGDKIKVTYIRDGKTRTTIATLKNTLGTT